MRRRELLSVSKQSLRKNRSPCLDHPELKKISLAFEKIVQILEECADEHYFPHREGQVDCDFCPALAACKKFFEDYAVNLGDTSQDDSSKYSLEEAINKFNQIRSLKKGGERNDVISRHSFPAGGKLGLHTEVPISSLDSVG